jgi:AcrR family transcriptional regulator
MSSAPPRTANLGRRAQGKAANRAEILAAARDAFVELGYGSVTVRDIVRRTGLASGTFYNYFPDKESVLRALVGESAARARVLVRDAHRDSRSAHDFVADSFRAYLGFVAEDPATFHLARRNAGTIRALFDEPVVGAGVAELAADLRAGVASGLLAPHDAEYMAAALVGTAFELATRMSERDPPDVEGAVAFAAKLFAGVLDPVA